MSRATTSSLDVLLSSTDVLWWPEPSRVSHEIVLALDKLMAGLDSGQVRVVQPLTSGCWKLNQRVFRAIQISARMSSNRLTRAGDFCFHDHLPTKFAGLKEADLIASGVRLVPPAIVHRGSYLGRGVVLMPSFVGIGVYVDDHSMIDSWASVGVGVQIGKKVHVSVNAIVGNSSAQGGTLPAVVEDNCFIGAGSVVADGVIVEANSVLGMGVVIEPHTDIYDRDTGEVTRGRVPSGSVVVAGTLPHQNGHYGQPCAVIVKRVSAQTLEKVGVNHLLRQ